MAPRLPHEVECLTNIPLATTMANKDSMVDTTLTTMALKTRGVVEVATAEADSVDRTKDIPETVEVVVVAMGITSP